MVRPVVSTLQAEVLAHYGRLAVLDTQKILLNQKVNWDPMQHEVPGTKVGFIQSLWRGCRTKSEA